MPLDIKYDGFDGDNIRMPQMPKTIDPSLGETKTTYIFDKVFYKVGDRWFKENFTIATSSGTAAAKKLLLGAVYRRRSMNDHEKGYSFEASHLDGRVSVLYSGDGQEYDLSQEDLLQADLSIDVSKGGKLQKLKDKVDGLKLKGFDIQIPLALHSSGRQENLSKLEEQKVEKERQLKQMKKGPDRDQLVIDLKELKTQIKGYQKGVFQYYCPEKIAQVLFKPDADQVISKVETQMELLTTILENSPFNSNTVYSPAQENNLKFSVYDETLRFHEVEALVEGISRKLNGLEQAALALN